MNKKILTDREAHKYKAFWEMKARRYPLPFDEQTISNTLRVIDIVRSKGVDISQKKILDIGCGTGIYTLPLAKEAAFVIGLDSSETMLSRLKEQSDMYGIRNVDILRSSWKDLDISAQNFLKAFEIVWVAMSMAVRDVEDLQKMEACSRRWCVYIGWGRLRKNELMEKAFQLHGLRFGPPQGAQSIFSILRDMGRTPSLDFIETSWNRQGTIEETIEDIAGHIRLNDTEPDIKAISLLVNAYSKEGMVYQKNYVEEGIIVWQS